MSLGSLNNGEDDGQWNMDDGRWNMAAGDASQTTPVQITHAFMLCCFT